jgi:hypothetical protein
MCEMYAFKDKAKYKQHVDEVEYEYEGIVKLCCFES